MKKVITERSSILNKLVINDFLTEHFEIIAKFSQNNMTYMKLEGEEKRFIELQNLILYGE